MTESQKKLGLLGFFAKGFIVADETRTEQDLEDRSLYIGASDFSSNCERRVIAGKLNPSKASNSVEKIEESVAKGDEEYLQDLLRRLVTFGRGHAWEYLLGKAFAAIKVKRIPQLEIRCTYKDAPVVVHVDDTLVFPDGSVRVLEHKNNEEVQRSLYDNNELQLYGQIGLLQGLWNLPCFGVKEHGKYLHKGLTFPQLVKAMFGFDFPLEANEACIEGYVVSATFNTKVGKKVIKPYGPYVPDFAKTEKCLEKAKWLWRKMQAVRNGTMSLDELWTAKGSDPLCPYCEFYEGCPKFQGEERPDLEAELSELWELKEEMKRLEKKIKVRENKLNAEARVQMKAQTCFEEDQKGCLLLAGPFRYNCVEYKGRITLNKAKLETELTNLPTEKLQEAIELGGFTADMIQEIVASASEQGDPYVVGRLTTPKVRQKKIEPQLDEAA